MRRFSFACGLVLLSAFLAQSASAKVFVRISKSTQTMQVYVDGSYAYEWPVSTGRGGYSTPSGSYRPQRLERRWFSTRYNGAPMHNAVFFNGGYAIHGTNDVDRLGRPASHGCVRLAPGNAAELYALIREHGANNTRITISH